MRAHGRLEAGKRKTLRDSAFACVDPSGRRRLPIHDKSHVRSALARFSQVIFEDEAAWDRARTRLRSALAAWSAGSSTPIVIALVAFGAYLLGTADRALDGV
jgi:hypothetical protein